MLPGYEEREISASTSARDVPADVFCYPFVETWRARIWGLLSDILTEEVKTEFAADPPEYVVSDDLTWLDDLIFDVTGEDVDIKKITADRISRDYRAFRGAHATRANDLSSYYTQGLRILSNVDIENQARALFLNGQYPRVNEEKLDDAICDLNGGSHFYRSDQEARVYLCADESNFLTRSGGCGHYLDFGSEYLFNLAIRLVGKDEAMRVLRSNGEPTIIIFDVPMPLLRTSTVQEFSGLILELLFCELVEELSRDS